MESGSGSDSNGTQDAYDDNDEDEETSITEGIATRN